MTSSPVARIRSAGRSSAARGGRARWKGALYVLPAFVVFMAFVGVPMLQTGWYSLWNWDGLGAATWAGPGNYIKALTNPTLLGGLLHIGILVLFFAAIPVVAALLLTVIMSRARRMPGVSVFRAMLFLPQIVPSVVIAIAWVSIYSQHGLVNQLTSLVTGQPTTTAWLGTTATALPAVGLIGTWLGIGLCVVLFVSGVTAIPVELYEAARLDGAGILREFFTVTLPGLRGHITIALVLMTTTALKGFDLVYVTTRGGPGTATEVPAFQVYNLAFNQAQVGTGSAVAVILVAATLLVTALINRLQPEEAA